jgi:hypothetical protein
MSDYKTYFDPLVMRPVILIDMGYARLLENFILDNHMKIHHPNCKHTNLILCKFEYSKVTRGDMFDVIIVSYKYERCRIIYEAIFQLDVVRRVHKNPMDYNVIMYTKNVSGSCVL